MQRVRIKMCGMTRAEDIQHAVSLGVDAIGLIFYPKSARYVTLEHAQTLTQHLPPFVDVVAVFVNPEFEWVDQIIKTIPLQFLQFHGDESPEFCSQFSLPYIKAIAATTTHAIETTTRLHSTAAAILLDTPSLQHGGTGKVFDWTLIPKKLSKPLILAGGLTAENVQEVTHRAVYAVDVCSGVESAPGVKEHHKMNQFVKVLWGRG